VVPITKPASPIPESLQKQLESGFKEVDGCVVPISVLPSLIWSESRPRADNIDDETGFECLVSKVHLDGMVPKGTNLTELARLGLDFAFLLCEALLDSRLSLSSRGFRNIRKKFC
jgi:hypothetical protein